MYQLDATYSCGGDGILLALESRFSGRNEYLDELERQEVI